MLRSLFLTTSVAAVFTGLLVLPGAASANGDWGIECNGVTDCVSVQSPWVGLGKLGSAGWELYCTAATPYNWEATPTNGGNIGVSWQGSSDWVSQIQENPTPFFHDTYGPSPPGLADQYATNWDAFGDQSFRYAIGCSDQPNNNPPSALRATAGVARQGTRSTRETALPDKGHMTVVHRCPSGQALKQAHQSVGYYTTRPPKALRHRVRTIPSAHGARFEATTLGGAQGRMRLQTTVDCG